MRTLLLYFSLVLAILVEMSSRTSIWKRSVKLHLKTWNFGCFQFCCHNVRLGLVPMIYFLKLKFLFSSFLGCRDCKKTWHSCDCWWSLPPYCFWEWSICANERVWINCTCYTWVYMKNVDCSWLEDWLDCDKWPQWYPWKIWGEWSISIFLLSLSLLLKWVLTTRAISLSHDFSHMVFFLWFVGENNNSWYICNWSNSSNNSLSHPMYVEYEDCTFLD